MKICLKGYKYVNVKKNAIDKHIEVHKMKYEEIRNVFFLIRVTQCNPWQTVLHYAVIISIQT